MSLLTTEAVGGEVVSICTKCRVETHHTVASKVGEKIGKVRCKTCGSLHRYIRPGSPVPPARRKASKVTPEETWDLCMKNTTSKKRTVYSPSGAYQLDDVIDHSHFGVGVVTLLTAKDKIQVTFKDGPRILIMGMREAV